MYRFGHCDHTARDADHPYRFSGSIRCGRSRSLFGRLRHLDRGLFSSDRVRVREILVLKVGLEVECFGIVNDRCRSFMLAANSVVTCILDAVVDFDLVL